MMEVYGPFRLNPDPHHSILEKTKLRHLPVVEHPIVLTQAPLTKPSVDPTRCSPVLTV